MLGSLTKLHVFQGGSVTGACCCSKILLPHVHLFRSPVSHDFLFMDYNAIPHRTVAVAQLLDRKKFSRHGLACKVPGHNCQRTCVEKS